MGHADRNVFYYRTLGPGPGTWGSVIGVLIWLMTTGLTAPTWRIFAATVVALAVVAMGIPAAARVSHAAGERDPSYVIVDEIAGQLVTLIGAPFSWKSTLVGVLLFRVFDITKPFPLRRLEQLPEGLGIMMDDLAAGASTHW